MSQVSQFSLLGQKRFGPYYLTQFLGAFNDNVFKNALLLLIAFQAAERYAMSSHTLINLSAGLFILPFFLFSATAGQLADKFEKSMLIRGIKLLEITIMSMAAIAFWLDSVPALIALLFLMGVQSSLFGPVKYGILPQILEEKELLKGNGLVGMATFMAILLGTACGGLLIGIPDSGRLLVAAAVLFLAFAGYLASRQMPVVQALDPDLKINWNPIPETVRLMAYALSSRLIFISIAGISWFWFLGATYLAQLPNYTLQYLGGNEEVVTLLLALFSIGIGLGSLLCDRLTGHRICFSLVPVGMLGVSLFGFDLAMLEPLDGSLELMGAADWFNTVNALRVLLDIVLLGVFGGFFIVPLYAWVQTRTDPAHRSRVIAANNVLNALLMVFSASLAIGLLAAGWTIGELFILVSILNLSVFIIFCIRAPEILSDFTGWIKSIFYAVIR
ncbi:MAG: MFS transporter [Gammaproteobacteria bacterium]